MSINQTTTSPNEFVPNPNGLVSIHDAIGLNQQCTECWEMIDFDDEAMKDENYWCYLHKKCLSAYLKRPEGIYALAVDNVILPEDQSPSQSGIFPDLHLESF